MRTAFVPEEEGVACSPNVRNDLYSRWMLWGDILRCMFLKERALKAATMYTMTSTLGVRRGGQLAVHVPEGEGTAVAEDFLQPRLAYATKVFLYSVL
jgi:hypothetical protein